MVAPYEGPLRDATAGRSVALAPRVWVPDDFGLARYLAAGLATLHTVDPSLRVDLAALADELDAEAFRNSAGRELFTNPAKALAERMSGRDVVLAGDNAATLALARHGAAILLRIAHQAVAAVGLADALVALAGMGSRRRPIVRRRYSTTNSSTVRCRSGFEPSCWPPTRSGRWSSRGWADSRTST